MRTGRAGQVVGQALRLVRGTYGICVLFDDEPDLLIGARNGSPLILGIGARCEPGERVARSTERGAQEWGPRCSSRTLQDTPKNYPNLKTQHTLSTAPCNSVLRRRGVFQGGLGSSRAVCFAGQGRAEGAWR